MEVSSVVEPEVPVSEPVACPIPAAAPASGGRVAVWVELGLIVLTVVAAVLIAADSRWTPELRWVFGYAAAVILGQGLVRDLARIALRRAPPVETFKMTCLCAESSLGLVLLLVGAGGLTLLGVKETILIDQTRLGIGLLTLLLVGLFAKDYVVVVKRVEDHAAVRLW